METDLPLPVPVSHSSLNSLIAFALNDEGVDGAWEIALLFTSDERIQAMHGQFMGLDSPTDIMTFPYEAGESVPSAMASRGGDIVISVETAALHAADAGWQVADELRFLTLHGVLHILGWDDADPNQRTAMLTRQSDVIDRWRNYAGDVTG